MNIIENGACFFQVSKCIPAILKNYIENQIDWWYIRDRKSTHSKVDATQNGLNVLTDTAYPVCPTG